MNKYLDDSGLSHAWLILKQKFLGDISYDATNKKIKVTKNGQTSDLVTAAAIVADGGGITDISGKADKTDAVTAVTYDTANHKFTKTINGATTDIVAIATIKLDLAVSKTDVGLGNVTNVELIPLSYKGVANGVAELDSTGKVPASQLPSYVDDVIESYGVSGSTALSAGWLSDTNNGSAFTPETGKIYVLMSDFPSTNPTYYANSQFRWGGSAYVQIYDSGITSITNAEIETIMAS